MTNDLTPMMRQYLEIKEDVKDAILFFRLGDFYEMFFEDAAEATRILHITLTSRSGGNGKKIPMCGVPHHAANNYIARLIRHGKKVAICEQVEEPSPGKKIVKRAVTKIITPGTYIADELLGEAINNYILSLNVKGNNIGMAYADISTGEFRVTQVDNKEDFLSELYKISPSECMMPESLSADESFQSFADVNLGTVTLNDDWMFDFELGVKEIKQQFSVKNLDGFGCQDLPLAVGAAGALLKYLKKTQRNRLDNLGAISTYRSSQFLVMDWNSHRNLELIQNMEDLSSKGTLFEVLDETHTPMGKRGLKRWILNPLLDVKCIKKRQEVVQYFYEKTEEREKIRKILVDVYDIERLSNKISLGTANARDMLALANSLKNIKLLKKILKGTISGVLKDIVAGMDDFVDVIGWIEECLDDELPVAVKEGGFVRLGYDPEVDELRDLISNGKDWIVSLQKKEIERTKIGSLKVGFNKVFGYYIEVTKTNLDSVPSDYIRKQTLVNAERYITRELKEHESKIIGAKDRIKDVEYAIFCRLREKVGYRIESLKRTSDNLADLDVLSALAEAAVKNRYVCPEIKKTNVFNVKNGRHPVLERILKDKEFVPNDIRMDAEKNNIFIITGSNMAGKSTFIRQIALMAIMAQIGSFVPASEAEIGVLDRIFTRVGASDRLYRGMSTFMVEMVETANILNNATGRSLIILDEIGRGTSTFDGVSIAWAVVEFIHKNCPGAKALFATHYHELTELSRILPRVKNFHLSIQEWKDEVIFLYKVEEGSCDESFGIHVAKLAGMSAEVVTRARDILDNLQKDSFLGNIRSRFSEEKELPEKQLDMFDGTFKEHPVVDKLKKLNVDNITPIDALKKLAELKEDAE